MTEKTAFSIAKVFFSVFSLYAVFLVVTMITKGPLSNLANPMTMANAAEAMTTTNATDDVASRIAPAGRTKMKSDEPATETVVAVVKTTLAPAAAGKSGEEVYNGGCGGCHGTGVLGAPKKGVAADWDARMAGGIDAIVTSAINGKGAMPPKGGNAALSDAEIKAAIEFMLN